MSRSLHVQLQILNDILSAGYSTAELCQRHGASERTMKRHLAALRDLGVVLESSHIVSNITGKRVYFWYCQNKFDIERKGIFRRWMQSLSEQAAGLKLC